MRKRTSQRPTSSFSKPVRRQPALHCSQCSPPRASSQWKTVSHLASNQAASGTRSPQSHRARASHAFARYRDQTPKALRPSACACSAPLSRHSISSLAVAGECGGRERTHCEWKETSMSAYFVGFIRTLTQDHVHGVCSNGVRLFDHFFL